MCVFLCFVSNVGITPMLQIIRHVFKDPEDCTNIWLIFANQVKLSLKCFQMSADRTFMISFHKMALVLILKQGKSEIDPTDIWAVLLTFHFSRRWANPLRKFFL